MRDVYAEAAVALLGARHAIAVTGAGVSAESGIPTFRGASGIWAKYPPEEYATFEAYVDNPVKVWRFWRDLAREVVGCAPNPAHYALAELERRGVLKAVITQNVDNLHQQAGSRCVIEYHGNARRLRCMACGAARDFDVAHPPDSPPYCPCGGLMKPDVVMFGELIPAEALDRAYAQELKTDLVLVVGTSAQVYPAAEIPFQAKRNGAYIIEANTERTDFTREITDAFLEGPAGVTLPRLAALVLAR